MNDQTGQSNDRRVFLGLAQPPLVTAATWLTERYSSTGSNQRRPVVDMENVLVVLPTARSTERILQLLVTETEIRGIEFVPPLITTVGNLPEFLYRAKQELASDLAQQLAWAKAIEQTPKSELQRITGRSDVDDLQDWQPLATLIARLHGRLANDILSFRSVARRVKDEPNFLASESDRWDALNQMQQRYYGVLKKVNLWDRQAARNYAASGLLKNDEIRCSTQRDIIVIGAADLSRSISEMLRQVATTNPSQVSILVAAATSMEDCFDEFGSLITEKWLEAEVELRDDQILVVDQPADQADATAFYLSNLPPTIATDEITIGVPDPKLAPQLGRSLNAIGVPFRSLIGRSLHETSPVRLMMAAKEYLQSQTFDAFASLVRHADLFAWLVAQSGSDNWLHALDQHQNVYLPSTIALNAKEPFGQPSKLAADFWPGDESEQRRAKHNAATAAQLNTIHAAVSGLLSPLSGPPRPIAAWNQPWSFLLVSVYGGRKLNSTVFVDRQIIQACEAIHAALGNQKQLPAEFDTQTTASLALDWAIQAAAEIRVIPPSAPNAIELAGWLDLALDDAPAMVVTSVNDEHVPASEVGHQFLPNELCRQLNILDNDRRYARDAYALTVIASVRENLQLIAGRRNEKGDPKKPSRLLFATNPTSAAVRAKAFFQYEGRQASDFWITDKTEFPDGQQLAVPQPNCSQPLARLSVTKFKSFLECPYRFYLKHVLKLDTVQDDWRELSGGTFGDLCHNVLETFARSEYCDLDDEQKLLEHWNDTLSTLVAKQFPGSRLPAVQIQVQQLRLRLDRFAPLQAQHRKAGWQIVSGEELLEHAFMVDGEPFTITGKIDRVDRHEHSGIVAVWDYKSSDKGQTAAKAHYRPRKQEWIDLQLPLYRHLVKEVAVVADADFDQVTTGYVLLPKKLKDIGFDQTSWQADELSNADELARSIIRKIRGNAFWPPAARPPQYGADFAAICQDNTFEQSKIDEAQEVAPW